MREFEVALHHYVTVLGRKRLIVLLKFSNPAALTSMNYNKTSAVQVTESLRQYLRQYTYIDYTHRDWFNRLLYVLPVNGLLLLRDKYYHYFDDDLNDDEITPLLGLNKA